MRSVKRLLGYIMTGVGLLGFAYFENYKGEIIPLPTAWLVLSIVIGITGAYLIVSAKMKNQIETLGETSANTFRIKEGGEKIVIDLDHCHFKEDSIVSTVNIGLRRLLQPTQHYFVLKLNSAHDLNRGR